MCAVNVWDILPWLPRFSYLVFQRNSEPYGTDPGLSPRTLEKVLYFASYIVLDKGETDLQYKQVLSEQEYQEARENWGKGFRVGMGAESIQELLQAIDLGKEYAELQEGLKGATGQKRARIVKRLEVVEAFRESGNKPEWMIMTCDSGYPAGSSSNGTA